MKSKNSITLVIAAFILFGGWMWLSGRAQSLTILKPITPSSLTATVALVPKQPVAREKTTLTFAFTNSESQPVTDLMVHHGRRVHVVIVGKDLASLGHIHPQDFSTDLQAEISSGVYSVEYAFPEAGKYIVAVDVMSAKDELAQQFIVDVKGAPDMGQASSDMTLEKCFDGHTDQGEDRYVDPVLVSETEVSCPAGYKVTLATAAKKIVAGEDTLLRFHFEKDGGPVTDLVPYLDAAFHLAVVPQSFDFALHSHGSVDERARASHSNMSMDHSNMTGMEGMHHDTVPTTFGPDLVSDPIQFPKAGMYRVFAQAKHGKEIIMVSFMVNVID